MNTSELREKSIEELNQVMLTLLEESFNLRMQKPMGGSTKTHRFSVIRRDIARIKTLLNERRDTQS